VSVVPYRCFLNPQALANYPALYLTIISDDPDESQLILPISGLVDIDSDGIAAAV